MGIDPLTIPLDKLDGRDEVPEPQVIFYLDRNNILGPDQPSERLSRALEIEQRSISENELPQ